MATGVSNDNDDYLSSCDICFGKYDFFLNRPKVLPCSHTFCFTCIQVMINKEIPLKCPTCRQTVVGIDKVESLPNNVHAEHVILLNNKLQKAEAETKISAKLLDAYFKSKKSDCQVFVVTDDHEPQVMSFNASKEAINSFHHRVSMKIPDTEKPTKLRVISWEGFMENNIPRFNLLMTSLIKILKSQNPDIVFLYNVEPATLDRLRKCLPNFNFVYEFDDHMSVTMLNASVSYDSHEAVQLSDEETGSYHYLKVEAHVGSLKLKLINAEIDVHTTAKWRKDFTTMMLNELKNGYDTTVNIILRIGGCSKHQHSDIYKEITRRRHSTVDVWKACQKPKMFSHIWLDDNMTETDVLEYRDFLGESSSRRVDHNGWTITTAVPLSLYLRPATSVFTQPKFYGEIELLDITSAPYVATLVDFDISSM